MAAGTVNDSVSRWFELVIWTCLACVIAGCYGSLHNQVTYSLSPDYFHAFKFLQFKIPPELQNRVGASIVGWNATWWLGLIIGPPLIISLKRPGIGIPIAAYCRCLAVVIVVAIFCGLLAYGIGKQIVTGNPVEWWTPANVVDPIAFNRVGFIHDGSYLGGVVGFIVGWWWSRRERKWICDRESALTAQKSAAS
jgi:hypothetical protein